MNLVTKIKQDVSQVFLRTQDFAENVVANGITCPAIVTITASDDRDGVNFRNVGKFALEQKLPYNSTIVYEGITWVVQSCTEVFGIFEHICYVEERLNFRG